MGTAESDWHFERGFELREMIDARMNPTSKYALGHGKACMRVVVDGTPVMFDHGRVPAPAHMAVRTP